MEGEKVLLIGIFYLELDGYFFLCEGEMDVWVGGWLWELEDGRCIRS